MLAASFFNSFARSVLSRAISLTSPLLSLMDYSSYFAAPAAAPYPFFNLPEKPNIPYTPQEEPQHDPLVSSTRALQQGQQLIFHAKDAYNDPNAFQFLDQTAQFNTAPLVPPPQSPPHSLHRPSISQALPYDSSGSGSNDVLGDVEFDQTQRAGSSDDDKDNLTPAQSRRKAQNRAAYEHSPTALHNSQKTPC